MMRKALVGVLMLTLSLCAYAQLSSGTHVYWYKATTNAYTLQDNPGPGISAGAFVHEGKIVTANNSSGLGYAGKGFSFGSNPLDNQGWCGVFYSANLNDIANAGGNVTSAYLRGEFIDYWSANGPLCNAGPVAIRCGVVDVSFGVSMWGGPAAMPDDAVWSDLDPMNTLDYALTIAGAESTINYTAPAGRPAIDGTPLLGKQFMQVDVTAQVNWILNNITDISAWAIVCLAPIGAGSTGKASISANENCSGVDGGATPPLAEYWSTDGNTAHLLCVGNLAQVKAENASAAVAGKVSLTNEPNPFNPTTNISYNTLGNRGALKVFNSVGKMVYSTIVSGKGSKMWDAGNLPSGVYFSRLTVGNSTVSKRIILIK